MADINLDSHNRLNCQKYLMKEGKSYPRTCQLCGLGGKCVLDLNTTVIDGHKPEDKYAVIVTKNIYHEGDERSRTHPGHGYPAYTEKVEELRTFPSLEKFTEYVRYETDRGKPVKAIKYQELSIETQVIVKVK